LPILNDIALLLQAVRRRSGLSQEAFASGLGIKLSRLQKWESGVNEPRFTIPELRRLRATNRPVFDTLIHGYVPLEPPLFRELVSARAGSQRTQPLPPRAGSPS
jgi:transcriptional regulator with XRE-family HTH domain